MKKTKWIAGVVIFVVLLAVLMPKGGPSENNTTKEKDETIVSTEEETLNDAEKTEKEQASQEGEEQADLSQEEDSSQNGETAVPKDHNGSSTVVIEPEISDEENAGLEFPCEIPGYDMEIEAMGSYTGMYVEDGTNEEVSEIAMLQVKNTGTSVIEYAELQVEFDSNILNFKISALPAGETAVLLEQQRKALPKEQPQKCVATVVQRESMGMSEEQVLVTDEGANKLAIKNLTDETIPTVRVFYKYYMEDKDMFLGGIAFSVKLTELEAGEEMVIQPAHFKSDFCRIVMVSVYDTTG